MSLFKKGDIVETVHCGSEVVCSYRKGTRAVITEDYDPDREKNPYRWVRVKWIRKNDDGTDVLDLRNRPLGQNDGSYGVTYFKKVIHIKPAMIMKKIETWN